MSKPREALGTGTKHGSSVEWDDPRWFTDQLKLMPDGSVVVRVTLATPKAIRSVKLNRYYWGHVLHEIAIYNGDEPEALHAEMCALFLKRTEQIVSKRTGEVKEIEIVGRTSELDNEEFWQFILKVRLFAAEFFQVETYDPDPNWRERQESSVA